MWSLKNDTKLFTRQTHRHRNMVPKGKWGEGNLGEMTQECGVDPGILLYME